MRITILMIEKNNHVLFESQYGTGRGKWIGTLPKEQENYFVELELEEKFNYGKNLQDSQIKLFKLECHEERMFLFGLLESIDEDGYAVLRMSGTIVSFEIAGGYPLPIGKYIRLETDKLLLYPVEY